MTEFLSSSKRCFKCRRWKDRSAFYAHPAMADGLLGKCKACTKRDVRRRYDENWASRQVYEQRRNQDPRRKAKAAGYVRVARAKHPGRFRCRAAVANAIRAGRLVKGPCTKCGTRKRVQAHHDDYRRPLVFTWACFRCHRGGEHGQRVQP